MYNSEKHHLTIYCIALLTWKLVKSQKCYTIYIVKSNKLVLNCVQELGTGCPNVGFFFVWVDSWRKHVWSVKLVTIFTMKILTQNLQRVITLHSIDLLSWNQHRLVSFFLLLHWIYIMVIQLGPVDLDILGHFFPSYCSIWWTWIKWKLYL